MKNSYNEWINRARSSLKIAKELNHEGIYLEDLCFQAQQAAEKALKAVMIFYWFNGNISFILILTY